MGLALGELEEQHEHEQQAVHHREEQQRTDQRQGEPPAPEQARFDERVGPAALVTSERHQRRETECRAEPRPRGPANLLAKVVCRDVDALYTCLTDRVATIEAIEHLETAPVISTLKRAATVPLSATKAATAPRPSGRG
ncbi:Lrp/AsnC ligand binding domain-containing protein [Allokutzneria albata]|uniref:AsnC family protein n=1 Tax=Allokutzneria albata TaxID=211114 RepID=A0A1G9SIB4_ALLAB|nr:Lrp/AsnC ligand binding domain-containing protein [Allokutzneria albata]SDM35151.1 AsnC family protein [Allokutzneria albata]